MLVQVLHMPHLLLAVSNLISIKPTSDCSCICSILALSLSLENEPVSSHSFCNWKKLLLKQSRAITTAPISPIGSSSTNHILYIHVTKLEQHNNVTTSTSTSNQICTQFFKWKHRTSQCLAKSLLFLLSIPAVSNYYYYYYYYYYYFYFY